LPIDYLTLAKYYKLNQNISSSLEPAGINHGKETGRKEVVAACMESPFYFTLPLQARLALLKQVEQQPALFHPAPGLS